MVGGARVGWMSATEVHMKSVLACKSSKDVPKHIRISMGCATEVALCCYTHLQAHAPTGGLATGKWMHNLKILSGRADMQERQGGRRF